MQEDIRITLFIIGIAIIGGVLLHGLWSIRKSSKNSKRASFESKNWEPGFEHEDDLEANGPFYDDVGVSKARVIFNPENSPTNQTDADSQEKMTHSTVEEESLNHSINEVEFESGFKSSLQNSDEELEQGLSKANITDGQTPVHFAAHAHSGHDSEQDDSQNSQTLKDEELESEVSSETKQTQEQAPVYSNVVTQPKPEFTRPIITKENTIENFGQPPESLLKKVDEHNFDENHPEKGIDVPKDDAQKFVPQENMRAPNDASNNEQSASNNDLSEPVKADTPEFSLNLQEGPDLPIDEHKPGVDKELSFAEQAKRFVRRKRKTVADKIRKEPVLKANEEDQLKIDFEEANANSEDKSSQHTKSDTAPDTNNSKPEAYTGEPEVLVLNVRANNDSPIEGAALLPMLLTLGFKFGEHDIFHRHVNTNGKGPILFSLTNMFKPGVFDIDNIENFKTLGVSLFMMLPIEGDAQQVFNMMHNATRKLADEFDCRILDGNKVALSKQSIQQYVERIREFERKRVNR